MSLVKQQKQLKDTVHTALVYRNMMHIIEILLA